MIKPSILFCTITSTIGTLQLFDEPYILTSGGPNYATTFYALYLYNNAFKYHKMGKACAMAWILFVIIAALTLVMFKTGGWIQYGEGDE